MLEMIIALGIIVSGIAGTLSLVTSSLNASNESQTRVVATGLAREAMEAVRALRDTAWRDGAIWNAQLVGPGNDRTAVPVLQVETGNGWLLGWSADVISEDAAAVSQDDKGLFRQSEGAAPAAAATSYRRLLTLWPICMIEDDVASIATTEAASCPAGRVEVGTDVRVLVTWTVSGRDHRLEMQEQLYDWR